MRAAVLQQCCSCWGARGVASRSEGGPSCRPQSVCAGGGHGPSHALSKARQGLPLLVIQQPHHLVRKMPEWLLLQRAFQRLQGARGGASGDALSARPRRCGSGGRGSSQRSVCAEGRRGGNRTRGARAFSRSGAPSILSSSSCRRPSCSVSTMAGSSAARVCVGGGRVGRWARGGAGGGVTRGARLRVP